MDQLKILIEGYAYEGQNGSVFATSTTVLVSSNEKKILVDPGANASLLLEKLKTESLSTSDIDILFLTHYHPDHLLNIRLFPEHDIYDSETIYRNDEELSFSDLLPNTNVRILLTPGHAHEQASLIVETEDGTYVVAQDVFWWMDGQQKEDYTYDELINLEDPYMKDFEALKESRKKVLEIADWIIPGHGKVFKNNFKK